MLQELILAALAYTLLVVLAAYGFNDNGFDPDPYGNPYRRYCSTCGQCQIFMAYHGDRYGWWETQGAEVDEACKCHKAANYVR